MAATFSVQADTISANPAVLAPTNGAGPEQMVDLYMNPGESDSVFPANILIRATGATIIEDVEQHPVDGFETEIESFNPQEVEFNIGGDPFEDYKHLPLPDFDPPPGPQKFATLTVTTGLLDDRIWLHPQSTYLVIIYQGSNVLIHNEQFENVGENLLEVGPVPVDDDTCFPIKGSGGAVVLVCL